MKIEPKYKKGDLLYVNFGNTTNSLCDGVLSLSNVISPVVLTGEMNIKESGDIQYLTINMVNRDKEFISEHRFITREEALKIHDDFLLPVIKRTLFGDFEGKIEKILFEEF